MAKNLRKQIIWCDQNSEIIIIKIAIMRIGAKTSANTNLSESFTKNKKRTSIKHLMKNNYLIAKPSGKKEEIKHSEVIPVYKKLDPL